jgi:hypothetical protein
MSANAMSKLGVSDATGSLASEFFALLDSINAVYIVRGETDVIVLARDGSVWAFTKPVLLREGHLE